MKIMLACNQAIKQITLGTKHLDDITADHGLNNDTLLGPFP